MIGYLHALNAHDAAGARTYLAPEYQQAQAGVTSPFDDWVADVVSVRLRTMPPGITTTGLERQNPHYRDLVEFGVTYDAAFRTETETEFAKSAAQTRFFVVGRSRAHGTWLILDVGTGP